MAQHFCLLSIITAVFFQVIIADVVTILSDNFHPDQNQLNISKRSESTCSDLVAVHDQKYPSEFQHLRRPWVDNPLATAGCSATVTQKIKNFLHMKVPGLNGQSIKDVAEELQRNGCLTFPFGPFVRDHFLGLPSVHLDMMSNCDTATLHGICVEKWGFSNCQLLSGARIVHIGHMEAVDDEVDRIDAGTWNETFFGDGTSLEYTTNSIAFFATGLNIVIDITGQGVSDTCNKKINIPVAADNWDQWATSEKLYHFWILRVKGYTAADFDTMSYVLLEAKISIMKTPDSFHGFYCKHVLGGKWENALCIVEEEMCSEALSMKEVYDKTFEMDMDMFWRDNVKPLVDGLECSSCSDLAGDVCSESGVTAAVLPLLLLFLSLISVTVIIV